MMEKDLLLNNKIIAKFMFSDIYIPVEAYQMQYHSSWDWLMPVIGKISNYCEEPEVLDSLKYTLLSNDIDSAYEFVIDHIINYYNGI
jgi:hypothetical protein